MVLRNSSEVACLVYVVLGLLLSCRCKKREVHLNNCSIKRAFCNSKIESRKTIVLLSLLAFMICHLQKLGSME